MKYIIVAYNSIRKEGAIAISKALEINQALQYLNLGK